LVRLLLAQAGSLLLGRMEGAAQSFLEAMDESGTEASCASAGTTLVAVLAGGTSLDLTW